MPNLPERHSQVKHREKKVSMHNSQLTSAVALFQCRYGRVSRKKPFDPCPLSVTCRRSLLANTGLVTLIQTAPVNVVAVSNWYKGPLIRHDSSICAPVAVICNDGAGGRNVMKLGPLSPPLALPTKSPNSNQRTIRFMR